MQLAAPSPLATPAIDEIWRVAAARVGFSITRTDDAYATSNGAGVIAIGASQTLDVDDACAQLVFHELCHAITQGEAALQLPDWGLENVPEHTPREHACLRVQAHIADRFGLRALMAPTTPYRAYYAALPGDPLQELGDGGGDPAEAAVMRAAREAATRFDRSSWRAPVEEALAATAALIAAPAATGTGARGDLHPLGFALGPSDQSCGTCAWRYVGGRGTPVARCRQSAPANGVGDGARVAHDTPACARWEPPVDCRTCGACCREAYHSVTVSVRDPVVWQEPALIERHGHRFEIRREGARCAALRVEVAEGAGRRYGCTIYENRPRPCREFAAGGRHCLDARRRVGLSARPA
jgi:hypothetical protein